MIILSGLNTSGGQYNKLKIIVLSAQSWVYIDILVDISCNSIEVGFVEAVVVLILLRPCLCY